MDRRAWWRTAGVVGGLVVAWCAYRLVVLGHHGALCRMPVIVDDKTAAAATRSAGSCLEYWINRYQTLIGVLAAVGAAWLTWMAAKLNVARVDASLDITRRQMAATAIEHLGRRQKALFDLSQIIESRKAPNFLGVLASTEEYFLLSSDTSSYRNLQEGFIYKQRIGFLIMKFARPQSIGNELIRLLTSLQYTTVLTSACHNAIDNCVQWEIKNQDVAEQIIGSLRLLAKSFSNRKERYNHINIAKDLIACFKLQLSKSPYHEALVIIDEEIRSIDEIVAISLPQIETLEIKSFAIRGSALYKRNVVSEKASEIAPDNVKGTLGDPGHS